MLKRLCVVALLCASAISHADSRLPSEIYQPPRATLIKAKEGRHDMTATFNMRGGNVVRFARDIIYHANKHGFKVTDSDINRTEADIELVQGSRKMSVSVDLVDEFLMEYRVDLDKK